MRLFVYLNKLKEIFHFFFHSHQAIIMRKPQTFYRPEKIDFRRPEIMNWKRRDKERFGNLICFINLR